ncbi:protein of unknown function [Edaphobacillus lindanitolerans]|uniref:Protein-glutamine gamma-glutamyltransferase-like C-terminal domain-containing protein n=2 Tax=Edaphobacillus lindanitolerans TaxID=550447 RepID=A0A1U7PKN2_9BACI|nr:protein of unknown function [Edaphobacillus lindanitolerans]
MAAVRLAGLLLEFSAVYLFSAPPHLFRGELPPVWPMAVALLAGGAGFLLFRKAGPRLAGLFSALCVFVAGTVSGLSLLFSLILAVIAVWRFTAASAGKGTNTELLASVLSIAYGLAAFFLIGGEAGNRLLQLLILQFGLAVFVRAAKTVVQNGDAGRRQDRILSVMAAGFILFAGTVFYMEPIMARLAVPAAWLAGWAGRLFGWTASPFLGAAEPLIDYLDEKQKKIDGGSEKNEEAGQEDVQFPGGDAMPEGNGAAVIFFMIFAAVAVGLILFLLRRQRQAQVPDRPGDHSGKRMAVMEEGGRRMLAFRPPADPVRREVYRLEKRMARRSRGRRPGQTFGEWLSDLGTDGEAAGMLEDVYSRIRYAEEPLSKREIDDFRLLIRKIG